jgi:catechol-2,3-dioxygenase
MATATTTWVDIRTPPLRVPLELVVGYGELAVDVSDADRAARFYGETLGLGRPESTPDGARIALNPRQTLILVQRPQPRTLPETGVHQAYRVRRSDLDAIAVRLEQQGVELHRYHEDREAERQHDRYCADPDGNQVQLVAASEPGIDHAAVEAHDLEWAEVFYTHVLGAGVELRVGWRMADVARAWDWGNGVEQVAPGARRWEKLYTDDQARVPRPTSQAFFQLGPGVTFGVYLSLEHRQEPPRKTFRGTPHAAFWVRRGRLDELEARLKHVRLRAMEPSDRFGGPYEREGDALFVRDPAGNFLEFREEPS